MGARQAQQEDDERGEDEVASDLVAVRAIRSGMQVWMHPWLCPPGCARCDMCIRDNAWLSVARAVAYIPCLWCSTHQQGLIEPLARIRGAQR